MSKRRPPPNRYEQLSREIYCPSRAWRDIFACSPRLGFI